MKYTLLDLTQAVLSSMDSDEVNSIGDTVESLQVATVIRSAYFDIITRANLPEHYSLVNLDPSLDETKPVVMYIPSTVAEVIWLKYNAATTTDTELLMRPVRFVELQEFLAQSYQLLSSDANVATVTLTLKGNHVPFLYKNDRAPTCYTSFDDNTLIFDAYDAAVDTTLQSSKTLAYARLTIPWTMADTFMPPLDDAQFALLLNEAKSLAWAELKQTAHVKAEKNSQRGWSTLQKNKHETEQTSFFDRLPNYGRR